MWLRWIDGERGATLTFAGALVGLPVQRDNVNARDVGTESTKLVRAHGEPRVAVSIGLGAVRVSERFAPAAPRRPRVR